VFSCASSGRLIGWGEPGNKISMQSVIGSCIAIAGAGLYGYLKGRDAVKAGKAH
jgi:hypothetical protein